MNKLKKILELASPGPWIHHFNEDPNDNAITNIDGFLIASIHPYANIKTTIKYNQEFNHQDAELIVELRNNVNNIINEHEELLKWRNLIEKLLGSKYSPEEAEEKLLSSIDKLNQIESLLK